MRLLSAVFTLLTLLNFSAIVNTDKTGLRSMNYCFNLIISKLATRSLFVKILPFFLVFGVFFTLPPKALAAIFTLEPATMTVPAGTILRFNIRIDTEGGQTTSADAILLFDPNILNFTQVIAGDFYSFNYHNPDQVDEGRLYVSGGIRPGDNKKRGQGLLARVEFTGQTPGNSDINFDCTPGDTTDSNINTGNPNVDLLDCSRTEGASLTITTAATPTPPPASSPSPTQGLATSAPSFGLASFDTLSLAIFIALFMMWLSF